MPGQVAVLGLVYAVLALFTDSAYALLAGSLGGRFGRTLLDRPSSRYVGGGLYLGLGVHAALLGRDD
jgi:threonine/homoserine/homoserine lactone efflux protein